MSSFLRRWRVLDGTAGLVAVAVLATGPVFAQASEPAPAAPAPTIQRIKNPIAEFTGVDKITGRIITFDVYINETVQFGALQVTPRICYSRPKEEEPKTDSFVEVDEITLDRKIRRIFTGWMFAESPGLNAVEHPIYDVLAEGLQAVIGRAGPTSPQNELTGTPAALRRRLRAVRDRTSPSPSGHRRAFSRRPGVAHRSRRSA